MRQKRIPAVFMRGGTSNALVFHEKDLPADRSAWDGIFLAAMGSPDPNGRQLNGMGGGISSLSKVCIVGAPSRDDADIDYTFAQVSIRDSQVSYDTNCGNMSSAMGPFAVDEGLVPVSGHEALVRIHNTNTSKVIHSHFSLEEGMAAVDGVQEIPGVAGTGAPVRLEFLDLGGAGTGRLLPTGNVVDTLYPEGYGPIKASLVDAANPAVFVAAADLGLVGNELPADLDSDRELMTRLEAIRVAGAALMGIPQSPNKPKIGFVSPAQEAVLLSGDRVSADACDLTGRMVSMGNVHRALPLTGSICMATAARLEGSVVNRVLRSGTGDIRILQPSGVMVCAADVTNEGGEWRALKATVIRTQRRLFDGFVYVPASAIQGLKAA